MQELLGQLVNGVAIGNVYALIALGFTLVFGVTRITNFAQGSMVMLGAYFAWSAHVQWGLSLLAAALVAILVATAVGMLLELIAVEWLGDSAEIAPLLSTLAVSFVIDQGAAILWSPNPVAFPNPVADSSLQLGGVYVSATDAAVMTAGLVTMALLLVILQRTWLGRAVRAAAQDSSAAAQMGVRVTVAKLAAFGMAGAVAGVGGILVGMYFRQIDPVMGLPLGLKGFAAAMLGGATSIPGAIVGGLLIGVLEALAAGYLGAAFRDLTAFAVLLLVLLLRPRGLFGRGGLEGLGGARGAGAIPTTSPLATLTGEPVAVARMRTIAPVHLLVGLVLLAAVPLVVPGSYWVRVFALGLTFAVAALGLTVLTGTTGQMSVGHAALFGVGAYVAAQLALLKDWPVELVVLAALGSGLLAGVLFALPLLKLRDHTVALASLALGQIGYLIFLYAVPLTGGPMGLAGIPAPRVALLGGLEITSVTGMAWLCLVVVALAVAATTWLLGGRLGSTWRAIREDRLAAQVSGVPVRRYLVAAYALSGALTAVGGALYAYQQAYVSPDSFLIHTSFQLVVMVLLGGVVSPAGAVVGALLLTALPELLRDADEYRMVLYGVVLLLVVRYLPAGITSVGHRPRRSRARTGRRRDVPAH